VSPRVREDSVHPRLCSGACVWPLNFAVRPHVRKPWRIWLAFALAPTAACVVTSAVLPPLLQGRLTWLGVSSSIALTLSVAAAATILLAIPTYLVLRRRSRIRLIHCILSGLVIGVLGGGAIGGAVGLLAGVLFWLIGIWRNEDDQGIGARAA
jgi:hypothetical protein